MVFVEKGLFIYLPSKSKRYIREVSTREIETVQLSEVSSVVFNRKGI